MVAVCETGRKIKIRKLFCGLGLKYLIECLGNKLFKRAAYDQERPITAYSEELK